MKNRESTSCKMWYSEQQRHATRKLYEVEPLLKGCSNFGGVKGLSYGACTALYVDISDGAVKRVSFTTIGDKAPTFDDTILAGEVASKEDIVYLVRLDGEMDAAAARLAARFDKDGLTAEDLRTHVLTRKAENDRQSGRHDVSSITTGGELAWRGYGR